MAKAKRIILFVCFVIVAIIVTVYFGAVFGYYYAFNNAVSGFEIVNSMIYLTVTDKGYVDLGGEKYIVKQGGAQSLLANEFDSYTSHFTQFKDDYKNIRLYDSDYFKGLKAEKNGIKYQYNMGIFRQNKFILLRGVPIA